MRTSARAALTLVMAMSAAIVISQVASASHPRPVVAPSVRASLVPAYNQCTATNRTHGPPLDSPSCNPPAPASSSVTVGDAPPAMVGSFRLAVIEGVPGPPEDSDAKFVASITDVRCKAGTTACGAANAAGGPDYTGELQGGVIIRVTDHFNAPSPGGGSDPGTVVDLPLPVNMPCTATPSTAVGGTCSVNTTFDTVFPNDMVKDGKRAVIEITQPLVRDGGPDGVMNTSPNTLFAVQGYFVP